jgi:hypothetical protein
MDTRPRLILSILLFIALLLLESCSGAGTQNIEPTHTLGIHTPSPRLIDTTIPSPAVPTSPIGATQPVEASPIPSVTLADDGRTITLGVGQTFLLNLGEGYTWEVSVDDPSILSREVNILVIKGAQGVYLAKARGTVNLTATCDPLCRQSTPPCMAPSREFHIQVVVTPA